MAEAGRVQRMSVSEIRALRKQCAGTTVGHPKYPGTCANCDLGVAWIPHEGPQEEFVSSAVSELLYGGAAGGGKTAGLVAIPLRWVGNPDFQGIILRRETTQLGRLLKEASDLYPKAVPGAYPVGLGAGAVWRFPSGA